MTEDLKRVFNLAIESRDVNILIEKCFVLDNRKKLKHKSINRFKKPKIVYLLMHKGNLVYIGKTYSRIRLQQHPRKVWDTTFFFKTDDYTNAEHQLIKAFETKYNGCRTAINSHNLPKMKTYLDYRK